VEKGTKMTWSTRLLENWKGFALCLQFMSLYVTVLARNTEIGHAVLARAADSSGWIGLVDAIDLLRIDDG
jgi:hypothetical protein